MSGEGSFRWKVVVVVVVGLRTRSGNHNKTGTCMTRKGKHESSRASCYMIHSVATAWIFVLDQKPFPRYYFRDDHDRWSELYGYGHLQLYISINTLLSLPCMMQDMMLGPQSLKSAPLRVTRPTTAPTTAMAFLAIRTTPPIQSPNPTSS